MKDKILDITALGELLIDFTPAGSGPDGLPLYACNPGGAPANVAAAAAKQGGKTAFIGKVGNDAFGRLLADTLQGCGVCTDGILFDENIPTTLAVVSLDRFKDRSFQFYRNPGADCMLKPEEVRGELIEQARVFHFGSLSLTHQPAREATEAALRTAKSAQTLVSFDPNLRPALWSDLHEAKTRILDFMPYADIVKVSEEELIFLTEQDGQDGHADLQAKGDGHDRTQSAIERVPKETEEAAEVSKLQLFMQKLAAQYRLPCLFVTRGAKGALFQINGYAGQVPAVSVPVADTTGAGDAFMGAALLGLCRHGRLDSLSEQDCISITESACLCGSLTTTKKGGIPALPNRAALEQYGSRFS